MCESFNVLKLHTVAEYPLQKDAFEQSHAIDELLLFKNFEKKLEILIPTALF